MNTIELCEGSNFAVWCDQCDDWVSNFIPCGVEILCADCRNRLLIKLPEKNKKEVRIRLAMAMWGL